MPCQWKFEVYLYDFFCLFDFLDALEEEQIGKTKSRKFSTAAFLLLLSIPLYDDSPINALQPILRQAEV
jgi:hypothetical protein